MYSEPVAFFWANFCPGGLMKTGMALLLKAEEKKERGFTEYIV
jgi:hypothetical protein